MLTLKHYSMFGLIWPRFSSSHLFKVSVEYPSRVGGVGEMGILDKLRISKKELIIGIILAIVIAFIHSAYRLNVAVIDAFRPLNCRLSNDDL